MFAAARALATDTPRVVAMTPRVRVPSASSQLARSVGRVAQSTAGTLLARRSLKDAVEGRTVMVTGASSGIGRAAAVQIGRAGATELPIARFGSLTELGRTISPAVAKEILGATYRAFPDSAAAHGKFDESESASALQRAVAQLLRGAYW